MALVSASILGANPLKLYEDLTKISQTDYIHYDVMDGIYVPNIAYGKNTFDGIKAKFPAMKIDVHLMTSSTDKYINYFETADIISFHPDTVKDIKITINMIQNFSNRPRVGLALNPNQETSIIKPYLETIDLVLIMGVYPGFSGQRLLKGTIEKIRDLRKSFNGIITIDGGVDKSTAKPLVDAGADILVSGSFLFKSNSNLQFLQSQ